MQGGIAVLGTCIETGPSVQQGGDDGRIFVEPGRLMQGGEAVFVARVEISPGLQASDDSLGCGGLVFQYSSVFQNNVARTISHNSRRWLEQQQAGGKGYKSPRWVSYVLSHRCVRSPLSSEAMMTQRDP